MKLFITKTWDWRDIWLLKLCAFLFGIAAGAYFHELVLPYGWLVLLAAAILAIKPAIAYFKN
ncbi:MAG: hypothetical protein WA003_05660 [Desulfuromonadaceae bacterium]